MKLEGIILRVLAITVTVLPTHKAIMNGDISLVGSNGTAGRVELYNNGRWGTICDDNWDMADARVVCRQLGFRDAIAVHGNALFGQGRGPIHISNVNCLGVESSLIDCCFSLSINCQHEDDASVTCRPFDEGFVRLVGGNLNNGRVEMFINGQWGTICDDTWDILDATVVCRQLGFKGAISAPRRAAFGEGEGPIFLDTVECMGDEVWLLDCKHKQKSNCRHIEDAGVECFNVVPEEGDVRLSGGHGSAGRVEIFLDNQWGTVCDGDWDVQDATVVCRQLGFRDVISATRKATFGEGVGPIHLNSLKCLGDELSLLECEYKLDAACTHIEDAGVICRDVSKEEGDVRLSGGHGSAGRVEVYFDNQWGTVCDDDWDVQDATIVCRQLGFKDAISATRKATFGEGFGPIHLDSVICSGDELSLLECEHKREADCSHAEDAGVICREDNNARVAWIIIAATTLVVVTALVVGIKTGVLSKTSMNLVLGRIRNFAEHGRTVDNLSHRSQPPTTPELRSEPTPSQTVTNVKPESLEPVKSKINPESGIKTESILYTTIPAELILPAESGESYEIPCNQLEGKHYSAEIY